MTQNDNHDNNQVIFITGGVRSGKSSFAQRLAAESGKPVRYIATAEAKDKEMEKRIQNHRQDRPESWMTVEEPIYLARLFQWNHIEENLNPPAISLIDCITLWISNLLLQRDEDKKEYWETNLGLERVNEMVDEFLATIQSYPFPVIIVTNEVGLGGIEMSPLGRVYQDILGWTNQKIARIASEVYFVASGIPLQIKGSRQ